jgi:hypothetical protein
MEDILLLSDMVWFNHLKLMLVLITYKAALLNDTSLEAQTLITTKRN